MIVVRTTEGNNVCLSLTTDYRRSWTVPELLSIQHVTACDFELRWIAERLNVPLPKKRIEDVERVIWFGDMARFIVANL